MAKKLVPYAGHYKPPACLLFTQFFTAVYNQERLILQKIYVLNKEMWA